MKVVPIEGYPNYTISESGEVRNYRYDKTEGKIISANNASTGYLSVGLQNDNGVKSFYVHRLLAQHFIPNPNNYPIVNHISGVKDDNRIENLEWCTHQMNIRHSIDVLGNKPYRTVIDNYRNKAILKIHTNGKVEKYSSIKLAAIEIFSEKSNKYKFSSLLIKLSLCLTGKEGDFLGCKWVYDNK